MLIAHGRASILLRKIDALWAQLHTPNTYTHAGTGASDHRLSLCRLAAEEVQLVELR